MTFIREKESQLKHVINGNRIVIPHVKTTKFLGLHWDSKLTWVPHFAQLKSKCNGSINLLRSLSGQTCGADQETLIFSLVIRPRIDYGGMVYGAATKDILKTIDAITNKAIRIASGAIRTTPIEALQILTNEPLLYYRREELQLRTFFKYKCHFINPAHNSIVNRNLETFFDTRHTTTFPIILGITQQRNNTRQ